MNEKDYSPKNILSLIAVGAIMIGGIGLVTGCTDTARSQLGAYGSPAHVVCYSAELVIYDGNSTGKVSSPTNSDGYQFRDRETGKLVEVSGNCVIDYGE